LGGTELDRENEKKGDRQSVRDIVGGSKNMTVYDSISVFDSDIIISERERERGGICVNVLTRAESVKGTFPFNIHGLSVLSAQTDLHCCLHMTLA